MREQSRGVGWQLWTERRLREGRVRRREGLRRRGSGGGGCWKGGWDNWKGRRIGEGRERPSSMKKKMNKEEVEAEIFVTLTKSERA